MQQPNLFKIGGAADLGRAVYEMTHHTMHMSGECDGFKCMEIASSAAMGALINGAVILCKKPDDIAVGLVPKERGAEIIEKAVTPEVFVFAALMAAAQAGSIKRHDEESMAMAVDFGPQIFGRALAQWQRVFPDKNIEDYLEKSCVDLARRAMSELNDETAFNKAIADKGGFGFVMRNNGSIN